jgi:hypothetical protein
MTPDFRPRLPTSSSSSSSAANNNNNNKPSSDLNSNPNANNNNNNNNHNKNSVDFLTRVERDRQRRLSMEQQLELQQQSTYSFHPTMNTKSNKLYQQSRTRSPFELSRGDLLKQETNRRLLKMQREQEILQGVTFQPQISYRAKEYGKSRLQILQENPSEILKWAKDKQDAKERERQERLKQREEEELQSCTFKPQTTNCPAYIKRIAESINKMKSARNSMQAWQDEKAKPDWR